MVFQCADQSGGLLSFTDGGPPIFLSRDRPEHFSHGIMLANARPLTRDQDFSALQEQAVRQATGQIVEMMRDDQKLRAARGDAFEGAGRNTRGACAPQISLTF